MQKKSTLLFFGILFALSSFCQTIYLKGILQGSQEVPSTPSTGKGVILVQYDPGTNNLTLAGDYQGLSSNVIGSHIHFAAAGTNGGVVYPIANQGMTLGSVFLTTTLSETQEAQLLTGEYYVNIHTVNYPDGEVRAQLTQTTAGKSLQFSGIFSGAAEFPPNSSTGTGATLAVLDTGAHMLYVTGAFTGLGSNATMAHLHKGGYGENGPIMYTLEVTTGSTNGVFSLATAVTTQFEGDMVGGVIYANIHSVNFPGGEIRTQLVLGVTLPVKLTSFNGYRKDDKVELTWTVENQTNFKDFTIEQLNEGNNQWVAKGIVQPNGLNASQHYSFTDLPSPGANILLYRLKMTDLDGKKSYSTIVKINWKNNKAQMVLLSNPVSGDLLQFQLTGVENIHNASAIVMGMSGRVMARSNKLQAGKNSINISSIPAGVYKLMVVMGSEKIETSFLK